MIPGVFTQATVGNFLALADIDADGDLDLFTADYDRHFYFFENVGSPFSPAFALRSTNWQNILEPSTPDLFPAFFDIDSDGDLDLFCGTLWGWNQFWFFRNVGTPQNALMVLETQTFFGAGSFQFIPSAIFDIDQDGDGDFLLSTYNGGMVFFRNITGDSTGLAPPPVQRQPRAGLQISVGPNPANSNAAISFTLPLAQDVDLAVYNLLGARMATLLSGQKAPGLYTLAWDASGNASGVYFVRLRTPAQTASQKLTLIK